MKRALYAVSAVLAAVVCFTTSTTADEEKDRKEKPHYQLDHPGRLSIESGKDGVAVIVIKATDGYKINRDYPFKAVVAETEGLEFPKTKFTKTDIVDMKKPVLNIPFKGIKKGNCEARISLSFAVCTEEICEIKKPEVKIPIEVK